MNKRPVQNLGLVEWRKSCSPFVLHILDRLSIAGHQAYIVGGAVRDMLLGATPKDIDIVTSATPKELLSLFKRKARTIGKRFTIVHLYDKNGDYIEVSTLRRAPVHTGDANNYGTVVADDARRRDFTINGLYLDAQRELVLDAHNGVADIADARLRFIAPINESLHEDPVRMLRAIHFAAKLNWALPLAIQTQCVQERQLLTTSSPGRLLDVVQKLLLTGSGNIALHFLRTCQLAEVLFVGCSSYTKQNWRLVHQLLQQTDARIQQRQKASAPLLFASILWPAYHKEYTQQAHNTTQTDYQQHARLHGALAHALLSQQKTRVHILIHMQHRIADTWQLQWVLQQQPDERNHHHQVAVATGAFRMALALYTARLSCDEQLPNHNTQWEKLHVAHTNRTPNHKRKRIHKAKKAYRPQQKRNQTKRDTRDV